MGDPSPSALAFAGTEAPPDPRPDDCDYDGLDAGVRDAVRVLRAAGVETFESCEGGPGHGYPEPTIRFHGERAAAWHALGVAQAHGLAVYEVRRTWPLVDGEPTGPWWEMVLRPTGQRWW